MQKLNSERGMSLIEATIIVMVLAILTSVLAPSMGDYIQEARQIKAKEDVEALGAGIMRMLRDTGKPFPLRTANTTYTAANRVDLLVTEGGTPSKTAGTGTAAEADAGDFLVQNPVEWDDAAGAEIELATDHVVTNANAYTTVGPFPVSGGPKAGLGWRGGYISTSTGPDPWGSRYACVTAWLNASSDNTTTGKGTNNDSFCLSAGGDANVDTDMDAVNGGVPVIGDDLIYVMTGATR